MMRGLPLLLSLAGAARASSTTPWGFEFNNDGTGPDGPWAFVRAPVDAPAQILGFYPSLLETSMMVNASSCQAQSAQCVIPNIPAWAGSPAHDLYLNETSADFDASGLATVNGGYVTDLMDLQGSLRYTTQRLTLGSYTLDGQAMAVADNVTANFPNGDSYTVGVGYLSLYGGDTFTYNISSGTQTLPLTLALGYQQGAYASMSYGVHVGSVLHNITGKMFYGGYDRARIISAPIAAHSNSTFSLAGVSLGVAAGAPALLNNTSGASSIDGLLQTNDTATDPLPLSAQPDPGVPYMYLPAATCAALASHLPISYDAGLGLYLWNTSAPSYASLLTSPHHLTLHFSQSNSSTTTPTTPIAIPLALLNLTLDYPIRSTPTPYFPCRPYAGPDVVLGRAFLQAAHLAHNWHTGTSWLAQAPGPAFAAQDLKTIATGDTELTPLPGAQGHESRDPRGNEAVECRESNTRLIVGMDAKADPKIETIRNASMRLFGLETLKIVVIAIEFRRSVLRLLRGSAIVQDNPCESESDHFY
ncbi:putative aspartic-type endopeptidase [Diplodia seriata]|uniref:Putative aspartic-type endopeptidase n=1 Tax=Diplodia seriata TaxID=420778 RepID=A0A0G2FMV6_9PEZI|nr:putative aspartic-type endopeptidase [Diplodia seriata]